MIGRLIDAGVAVFRLNFSHGDLDGHRRRLEAVRAVAREKKLPIAVLGDLCGPKIRVGKLSDGGIMLEKGREVVFAGAGAPTRPGDIVLPTTYPAMIDEVQAGHRVLINDGAIRMLATEVSPGRLLRCSVTMGGQVTSGKGINLPDTNVRAPAITEADWRCVEWAVEHGLDFLALSFVRRAEEVRQLQERLASACSVRREGSDRGATIPVLAKIEKPQAIRNIDEILEAADAIMVARGDLGVEMDIAQVPVIQKLLVEKASQWGKPCIVATQMLETMIESPNPTRAEASDVANAIFDGADAVMLSAETATGRHPDLVVDTMRRIVGAAEARVDSLPYEESPPARLVASKYRTAALAHGAWAVAKDVGARLIVVWSESGGGARYLSQNNFRVPIIAYSSDERATRRMALLANVAAVHSPPPESGLLADWTKMVERDVRERGWARPGDPIVMLAGKPLGTPMVTNSLAIHYIGNPATGYV